MWSYENEWRIINIEKSSNMPRFIQMPQIKSITMGPNIDYLCKQLLWDICQEKDIPCYELILGKDNFSIERSIINELEFNIDKEAEYISFVSESYAKNCKAMSDKVHEITKMIKEENYNSALLIDTNKNIIDCLTDSYFIKISTNRVFMKYPNIENETIPETMINAVKEMDSIVGATKSMLENQKKMLLALALKKLVDEKDAKILCQQIFRIESLLEKIVEISWPNSLMQNSETV